MLFVRKKIGCLNFFPVIIFHLMLSRHEEFGFGIFYQEKKRVHRFLVEEKQCIYLSTYWRNELSCRGCAKGRL